MKGAVDLIEAFVFVLHTETRKVLGDWSCCFAAIFIKCMWQTRGTAFLSFVVNSPSCPSSVRNDIQSDH